MKYVLRGSLWVPEAWQRRREEVKKRMLDAVRRSNEPQEVHRNGTPDIRVWLDGIRRRPIR